MAEDFLIMSLLIFPKSDINKQLFFRYFQEILRIFFKIFLHSYTQIIFKGILNSLNNNEKFYFLQKKMDLLGIQV